MSKGKDLTIGNETKVILKFAIPMMIGNVFQQLYNVIDAIVVGKFVGEDALAAVGVSFQPMFLLSSLIIGFTIGGTILISQFYGAKKEEDLVKTSETLQIVLFIGAIIISIAGILLSNYMFKLMNVPAEILPLANSFFRITMLGSIGMFGYNALSAILRGLGDSKTPVYFLIISEVINIILDLVLILVFKMGVEGAAWATTISFYISYILAIIYLNKKHKIISTHFKIKFDKKIYNQIIKIGLPSSGQMLVLALGNIFIFSIINLFGTNVIASFTAASRLNTFAIMPAMFFSNALSGFVGQNYGAKKGIRIINGLKSTLIIIGAISIFFTLMAELIPEPMMKMFANDPNVIKMGVHYFRIVAPFYLFFGIMFSFNGVYRGMGNTIVPMYFTIVTLWIVRFPVATFLSMHVTWHPLHFLPQNYIGLFWGEPFAWTTGMILSIAYFFISYRKKIKKVNEDVKKNEPALIDLTSET